MSGAEIAQLAIILAPIARDIAVEGKKAIITIREDLTQEQINRSLELSRSATWPELTFGQP
ncbi:MAG: hypothetical protein WA003_08675 [Desulfuromonadaceae bacterium]